MRRNGFEYHQDMAQDWWLKTIASWLCLTYTQVFDECCRFEVGAVCRTLYRLLCCPLRCLNGILQARPNSKLYSQSAMLYFYILFLTTTVFNVGLLIARPAEKSTNSSLNSSLISINSSSNAYSSDNTSNDTKTYMYVLEGYTISYIWINILPLGYLVYRARELGAVCNRSSMVLTFYLRTGLYIFGILSVGYSLCLFMNRLVCHDDCCHSHTARILQPLLQFTIAVFVVAQILFLNSYYKLELPINTPGVQICYAHVLGTNLSLWIWTICREVHDPNATICETFPVPVDAEIRKIFYPVFVEYLLLAAAMFFENWSVLKKEKDRREMYQNEIGIRGSELEDAAMSSETRPGAGVGRANAGSSLMLGFVVAIVFIILVITSDHVGELHTSYYEIYVWFALAVYCTQILACVIMHMCVQTQHRSRGQSWDYDDALLYLSLAGALSWEGFHFYGLVSVTPIHVAVDEIFADLFGPVEYMAQTYIIVAAKRHHTSNDRNAKWISYCALYLLVTNFAHWCQDSFFIAGTSLEKPGEEHSRLESEGFIVLAHILTPLTVFFRFHSATCCYHVWTFFNGRTPPNANPA